MENLAMRQRTTVGGPTPTQLLALKIRNGADSIQSGNSGRIEHSGFRSSAHSSCQHSHQSDWGPAASTQMSQQAQMLMLMTSLVSGLMSGDFGHLMNALVNLSGTSSPDHGYGQTQSTGGPCYAVPNENPCFGKRDAPSTRPALNHQSFLGEVSRSQEPATLARGETKELKAGESVRGANGTLLEWGKDGTVRVSYKDKDGRCRRIDIKDGMASSDGGCPQKLDNRGQFLDLGNGDVVAIGNAERANGKKELSRVAMSDSVGGVPVDEAGKSSLYRVEDHGTLSLFGQK